MRLKCNFCGKEFLRAGGKSEYKCPRCRETDVEVVDLTCGVGIGQKTAKQQARRLLEKLLWDR
jgi:phage FluMu protein Com